MTTGIAAALNEEAISSLAMVASNARLEAGVRIGPYAVVGREGDEPVSIGQDTVVKDHVLVEPGAIIGAECVIEDHCRIGRGSVIASGSWIRAGLRGSGDTTKRHAAPSPAVTERTDAPISPHALVASNVVCGIGVEIDAFAIVGWENEEPVRIGARTKVSPFALVEPGAIIGEDCLIDAYCRVSSGAMIGDRTQILYGAAVSENAKIGEACIIGGNVADRTVIEDCVTHFGEIAHDYRTPGDLRAWDNTTSPSPTIRSCTVVGQLAVIVGGIEIGRGCYIAAGEVVRVSIEPGMLFQRGEKTPLSKMRGLVRARSDGICG